MQRHGAKPRELRGAKDGPRDLAAIRGEDGHHWVALSPQRAALAEGWPVLLSVMVVGIPFGIVARQSGLSPVEIMAMSLLVFAAAARLPGVKRFGGGGAGAGAC